jgi:hypothetical protein
MPISSITTNDTFGLLVTRTSQLITGYNALESSGAIYSSATANASFANGNTNFAVLQVASDVANTAFANGNTNFTIFQVASNVANLGFQTATASFANGNINFTIFQVASNVANLALSTALASFANGNINFVSANAAFAKANDALPNTTTTLAGTLTVTGDIIGKIASNTNTTVIRISTGTEFRAGTSRSTALGPADVFDAAAEVSLTDGSTITIDMSTGFNFNVNLTARATRSIATPTNMKPGQSGYIRIKQGAATAQTASYGAGWAFSGGVPPVFSTGTGNTDILFFQVLSTANVFGSLSKDLRLNY